MEVVLWFGGVLPGFPRKRFVQSNSNLTEIDHHHSEVAFEIGVIPSFFVFSIFGLFVHKHFCFWTQPRKRFVK